MYDTVAQVALGLKDSHPLSWYHPGRTITVNDKMQKRYTYELTARPGKDFDEGFEPEVTPQQMLELGVFEGKYCNDCVKELPSEWYAAALANGTLSPEGANADVNLFKVKSRKSLHYWHEKGWIPIVEGDRDVRGWFQWYCRYWLGRRQPIVDDVQIKRWRAFRRHRGQIIKNSTRGQRRDPLHRRVQRQALLQWAYHPMP